MLLPQTRLASWKSAYLMDPHTLPLLLTPVSGALEDFR